MILEVVFIDEDEKDLLRELSWVKDKCRIVLTEMIEDGEEYPRIVLKTNNGAILETWEGVYPTGVELLDKINEWEEGE